MLFELRLHRGDYTRRAVADVEAANSAGEIEVAIAVDVIDSGAFGARGEDGSSVRGAAGNGGFAAGHQSARGLTGNFSANLDRLHERFSVRSQRAASASGTYQN